MRSHLGTLQRQFDAQMQQLQRGQPFSSLPPVTLPTLPTVPTLELLLGSMAMPPSGAMPIQIAPQQPPVSMAMPFIQHRPASATPPVRVTPQTVDRIQQQTLSPAPLPNPAPVPKLNPAPPVPSHTPGPTQPAGKLDQLLDKLGARFPQCTRAQLISVLQQIKMARSGTMAGLSIEELTQQVTQRLAQMDRPSLGPIGPPSAARGFPGSAAQVQRTPPPSQAPAVAQVFQTRPPQSVGSSTLKMCLMCQNPVELGSQHDVSCSHVIHKEQRGLNTTQKLCTELSVPRSEHYTKTLY
ncbi:hypothetical protein JZ751_006389 [Albula glossodonta]|uniref:TTC3/DZIP3/RBM44-like helical domain-containing protein n=1 Tax=Albula glossodonta TaxID=121402 RepID=A0A8T2MQ27_9TELE|nr:hypothetical protein JZ751_006389 [Albula glossodonta]